MTLYQCWKDSYISSDLKFNITDFINIPEFGCFRDLRKKKFNNLEKTINNVWAIGGDNGWYYGNWLLKIRGYMDKLFGGVGLRRGRTNKTELSPGDSLDFWRVIYANKEEGRLLLFAEMKLPGEAWLEFKIEKDQLILKATFRPLGLLGRLYWFSVLPFHSIIFNGLLKKQIIGAHYSEFWRYHKLISLNGKFDQLKNLVHKVNIPINPKQIDWVT